MLIIPKGIGHRSMLCEDSTDENVLIELKIADDLTYVGESSNPSPASKTGKKKGAVRSTRATR